MLNRLFTDQLQLGLAQALAAAVVAYALELLARQTEPSDRFTAENSRDERSTSIRTM
jgi:hypothetical protein